MHGGHRAGPQPRSSLFGEQPTITQSEALQSDGSVQVTLTASTTDFSFTRVVGLSKADDGSLTVTDTRGLRELTEFVSADSDGGVDVTLSQTLPDGNTLTQHLELDVNSDGKLQVGIDFTSPSGITTTQTFLLNLASVLGSADESLTVAEVTEVLLEHAGVDITLTGVADLLASV